MVDAAAPIVEFWDVGRLRPYPRNPRTHSDDQVELIADTIDANGWTMPILVDAIDDDGEIIAGHGRDLAARLIYTRGGTIRMANGVALPPNAVPVIVARGWSDDQKRAYVLADNRIGELSSWDDDLLKAELEDLLAAGAETALTGFTDAEIEEMLAPAPQAPVGNLADRFGVPPFSVLNAREGWWQDRKRAWLSLGIKSELGRGAPIGGGAAAHGSEGGGQTRPRADR